MMKKMIFLCLMASLACALLSGCASKERSSIGMIGGADGPTVYIVS